MKQIAVIPAYRAAGTILTVVKETLPYVDEIVVVDDFCPEGTADLLSGLDESRVHVIRRSQNGGVGAATKTGIEFALEQDAEIVIKLDADGQMPSHRIPALTQQIRNGSKDFVKGNRFDSPEDLEGMPALRLMGNAVLSLVNKVTSGYWKISDPTNGFFAISRKTIEELAWGKVADDYFFESDLLFRLRLIDARVGQLRMKSIYGAEKSSLRPVRMIIPFTFKHTRNHLKRIIYLYYVRELNLGSLYLPSSIVLLTAGLITGIEVVRQSNIGEIGIGTAILSSIALILGSQFLLQFLAVDMDSEPN